MIIKKINIGSFGKLSNLSLDTKAGLNIIYGENESGKSTIRSFILEMFFGGTTDSFKRTIYKKEFEKYIPWHSDKFEGSLLIEKDKVDYLFERNFNKGKELFNITNLNNGEESSLDFSVDNIKKVKQLDEKYFGIKESTIRDLFLFTDEIYMENNLSYDLKDRITNYFNTKSEEISMNQIFDDIKENSFSKNDKKSLKNLKNKIEENLSEIDYIENNKKNINLDDLQELDEKIIKLEKNVSIKRDIIVDDNKLRDLSIRKIETEEKINYYESVDRNKFSNILFVIPFFWLFLLFLDNQINRLIIFSFILLTFVVILFYKNSKDNKTKSAKDRLKRLYTELDIIVTEINTISNNDIEKNYYNEINNLNLQKERLLERLRLEDQFNNRKIMLLDEIKNLEKEVSEIEFRKDMGLEATNILTSLTKDKFESVSENLMEDCSYFIEKITNGKYTKLLISDNGDIKLFDSYNSKIVNIENLSKGTIAQVYLSYRLGLIVNSGIKFPIIIDDGFTLFDIRRNKNSMKVLKEVSREYQIFFFTSDKKEFEDINSLDVNYIELGS